MKIAHFVNYGPHQAGMYETTREICEAECKAGHDAFLVDTSFVSTGSHPRSTFTRDRGVDIAPPGVAKGADLHCLHNIIPSDLYGDAPIAMFLHGNPEYSFYSEVNLGDRSFSTLLGYDKDEKIKQFITLWDRHTSIWESCLSTPISYVPSCANMDVFTPEGPKYEFTNGGDINIGFCDSWRPSCFKDPFKVIPGVIEFAKMHPDKKVKLHLFACPSEKKRDKCWDNYLMAVKRNHEIIGDIVNLVEDFAQMYRSLDLVVSPAWEENRVFREAMACGVPVVTGSGCSYSEYQADYMHPNKVADSIHFCVGDLGPELSARCRDYALSQFTPEKTIEALIPIFNSLTKST